MSLVRKPPGLMNWLLEQHADMIEFARIGLYHQEAAIIWSNHIVFVSHHQDKDLVSEESYLA